MIRLVIADDELLARKRLRRLTEALEGFEIIAECANGQEVLALARTDSIDVLLMDINMPGLSGLEALEALGPNAPLVILCTAHSEHAIDAFALGAIDYIVKPVELGRLRMALSRAASRLRQLNEAPPVFSAANSVGSLDRLPVETNRGVVLVDPNDVVSISLDGELSRIVTTTEVLLSAEPLRAMLDRLTDARFERVHRRAIVNLLHVVRLEPLPTGGYLAHMKSGQPVEVSRQAARDLRRRLGMR